MEPIKNKQDLKKILDYLYDDGFGYFPEYKLHQNKIDTIVNKANKLGINYNENWKREMYDYDEYDEAKKVAEEHFSKFGVTDKIQQYFKGGNDTFRLESDTGIRTPSRTNPNGKEIIEWVKFRNKLNLKDIFKAGVYVTYYDLDKNILKIHYGSYSDYNFKHLYKLVYNKDLDETKLDSKKVGEWQNLGEIEIKFFQKATASIKGNLKPLRELYYNYLKKENDSNTIVKYQGKQEILNINSDW